MKKIRVVDCDYLMAKIDRTSPFYTQKTLNKTVPVIRIFGNDINTGMNICAHIYGYYPYVTIKLTFEENIIGDVLKSMENLLNSKYKTARIHDYSIVKAKSIYGYHNLEECFLEIKHYNPMDCKKISDILVKGDLGFAIQPYNIHIPYLLKFFIDYNIFGMNCVIVDETKISSISEDNTELFAWENAIINPTMISLKYMGLKDIEKDCQLLERQFHIASKVSAQNTERNIKTLPSEETWKQKLDKIFAPHSNDKTPDSLRRTKSYTSNVSCSGSHVSEPVDDSESQIDQYIKTLYDEDIDLEASIYGSHNMDDILEHYVTTSTNDDDFSFNMSLNADLLTTSYRANIVPLNNKPEKYELLQLDGQIDGITKRKTRKVKSHANLVTYYPSLKLNPQSSQDIKNQITTSSPKGNKINSMKSIKKLSSKHASINAIIPSPIFSSSQPDSYLLETNLAFIDKIDTSLSQLSQTLSADNSNTTKPELTATRRVLRSSTQKSIGDMLPIVKKRKDIMMMDKKSPIVKNVSAVKCFDNSKITCKQQIISKSQEITQFEERNSDINTLKKSKFHSRDKDLNTDTQKQNVGNTTNFQSKNTTNDYLKDIVKFVYSDSDKRGLLNIRPLYLDNAKPQYISNAEYTNICGDKIIPYQSKQINAPNFVHDLSLTNLQVCSMLQDTPQQLNNIELQKPQNLKVMVCEILVKTRGDLLPNPECDPILMIVFSFYHQTTTASATNSSQNSSERVEKGNVNANDNILRRQSVSSQESTQQPHDMSLWASSFNSDNGSPNMENDFTLQDWETNTTDDINFNYNKNLNEPNINNETLRLNEEQCSSNNTVWRIDEKSQELNLHNGVLWVKPLSHTEHMVNNNSFSNHVNNLLGPNLTLLDCDTSFVRECRDEEHLLTTFYELINGKDMDPDILVGYENERSSWTYVAYRAKVLGLIPKRASINDFLSRRYTLPSNKKDSLLLTKDKKQMVDEQIRANGLNENELEGMLEPQYSDWAEFSSIAYSGKPAGRIVLNMWRLLRKHFALHSYTFESLASQLLGVRTSKYSNRTLNNWFYNGDKDQSSLNSVVIQDLLPCCYSLDSWRVLRYLLIRTVGVQCMIDSLDILDQTGEFARLYGIEFHNVLHRGSQYKVESIMLRMAKSQGYIAPSPTPLQRAEMTMSQMVPMVLEPESGFYADPVAVLDFQSLYPSIIIAYNLCYSTCLGYIDNWNLSKSTLNAKHSSNNNSLASENNIYGTKTIKFGCTELTLDLDHINSISNDIEISPVNVGFVNKHIREGILPSMLEQILMTRIRVKHILKQLKVHPNASELRGIIKLLDTRQMALKMIANVTFGYTSAYFSGRMPCVEIADSILSKAREILQTAIDYINRDVDRNGRVIYGDTDSIFVLLKKRSRAQAFAIGERLAKEISALYRAPIELKFEKIYQPCVLQSKKRYVGLSYESLDQNEPKFDAKGIETVRRDFCAAVPKILKKVIFDLLRSGSITDCRLFLQQEFSKINEMRVPLRDYIISREYRGRNGYKPKACVPSLEIAKRLTLADPMAEPLVKERVPYVIVNPPSSHQNLIMGGDPFLKKYAKHLGPLPLIALVRTPGEFLQSRIPYTLNAEYYITKQIIPPINRVLNLIGFDASKWYQDMPRFKRHSRYEALSLLTFTDKKKATITQYIKSNECFSCRKLTTGYFCDRCIDNRGETIFYLNSLARKWSERYQDLSSICTSCTSIMGGGKECISLDCPVFYMLVESNKRTSQLPNLQTLIEQLSF